MTVCTESPSTCAHGEAAQFFVFVQACVTGDDIKMQGVSLSELLAKYFLPRRLRLLPDSYWKDFRGFVINLHVSDLNCITLLLEPATSQSTGSF